MGSVGIIYIRHVYTNGYEMYEQDLKTIENLKSLSQSIKEIDQKVLHFSGGLDWEHECDCVEVIHTIIDENKQLFDEGQHIIINQEDATQYKQIGIKLNSYYEKVDEMITKTENESEAQVLQFYQNDVLPLKEEADNSIEKMVLHYSQNAKQKNLDNIRQSIKDLAN